MVPALRIRPGNDRPLRPGDYVLYWMIAARRLQSSFALDRALEHARALGLGLLVFEPLRVAYPWASARLHQWVIDGMTDNAAACAALPGVTYVPYVEPAPGAGSGLLAALAERAAVVVTDDFPAFFLPRMVAAAAPRLPARVEIVDGNGLIPLRAVDHAFPTAFAFRRQIQTSLQGYLRVRPEAEPFRVPLTAPAPVVPAAVTQRWPDARAWQAGGGRVADLPIDQQVAPVDERGGSVAALARLERFIATGLGRYGERNEPAADVTSGLSPALHFGHVSAHDVFDRVMQHEGWLGELPPGGRGAREGWWGVGPAAEGFLDQLVTWREVGFNMCAHRPDHDQYGSLPDWARATLARHADDPREFVYTRDEFAAARTHDPLWNAAQRQLVREGRLHNYLRMLWGKKILHWSPSPEEALATMIDLNNRYALDGRDPNSYSGIFWTLGRYDRPWGPEREIFGTIRYMSSDNTARKLDVKSYLARYGDRPSLF